MVLLICSLALGLGLTLLVIVVVSLSVLKPRDALQELGVKDTYNRCCLPTAKIDAYHELKEQLRSQHAKGATDGDLWMSTLPLEAKDKLKYRLMQRAIGGMAGFQKIETDTRGYWRLFSKGVITRTFWNSVMEAERELSLELESVKGEAAHIEPTQDPQGIISEAMQFIMRFGDKLPSAADMASSPDVIGDLMKQLPHAGMPGLGPPPAPSPGVHQPVQASGYDWRQDEDEVEVSVSVPNNATKAEVKVTVQLRSLRIEHRGSVVLEGQLAGACRPEGSTWTLSKGRVDVSLLKASSRSWWPDFFAVAKA